jgi:small-conductance mechanosensitive channel
MGKILEVFSVTSLYYAAIYLFIGIVLTPIIQRLIRKTLELKYKKSNKNDNNQSETIIRLLQSVTKYTMGIIVVIGI